MLVGSTSSRTASLGMKILRLVCASPADTWQTTIAFEAHQGDADKRLLHGGRAAGGGESYARIAQIGSRTA